MGTVLGSAGSTGFEVVNVHGHYVTLTVSKFVKALQSFLCAHLIPIKY